MKEQLSFTPAIATYVKQDLQLEGPAMVMFIFSGASILPILFTSVFVLEHIAFNPLMLLIWAGCYAIAGVITIRTLRSARLMRRDLAAARYVRWTGFYAIVTQTYYRGARTKQITVGDEVISNDVPPELVDGSFIGAVDYLLVSRIPLEIRDQSGQVLWSRIPTS